MNSVLKQRVVTGLALVFTVLLGVIFLPNLWFAVISLIVMVSLAGFEWGRLVSYESHARSFFVVALLAIAFIIYLFPELQWVSIISGVVWWAVILVLLAIYERGSYFYKNNKWILRISAFLVLIPAWVAIITLHKYYPQLVLYLIFLVAIADSGAYFSGKAFGKQKLAPELSPGKTREGALGGLFGALIWSILGASYFSLPAHDWLYFIFLSLSVALLSIAGDLFESLIKREAGQKDSGNILPGHGGILDRIDGLLATLPLFTLGIFWGAIQV